MAKQIRRQEKRTKFKNDSNNNTTNRTSKRINPEKKRVNNDSTRKFLIWFIYVRIVVNGHCSVSLILFSLPLSLSRSFSPFGRKVCMQGFLHVCVSLYVCLYIWITSLLGIFGTAYHCYGLCGWKPINRMCYECFGNVCGHHKHTLQKRKTEREIQMLTKNYYPSNEHDNIAIVQVDVQREKSRSAKRPRRDARSEWERKHTESQKLVPCQPDNKQVLW